MSYIQDARWTYCICSVSSFVYHMIRWRARNQLSEAFVGNCGPRKLPVLVIVSSRRDR
ncbi:hypothetical protein L208DRAFT_1401924 [Tricholoma matsutake]|nr:hypothetical protein L208DRAFT_1401924 [Tricholoma matsutake 945]